MFLEPHFSGQRSGWLEVICGSMFSGKTEELIRRLKRAEIAGQRVEVFKPRVDTRYAAEEVVSHDDNSVTATPLADTRTLLDLPREVTVVGLDEAQFFSTHGRRSRAGARQSRQARHHRRAGYGLPG